MSDSGGERERWTSRYAAEPENDRPPSPWVLEACAKIPAHQLIVDIGAGTGRHAAALASEGHRVVAMDFVEAAVGAATRRNALVYGLVADATLLPFAASTIDVVLCVNFLDRSLFDEFKALLKPGGFLVYETYTVEHLRLVKEGRARAPRSPSYTLQPGELLRLVAPLAVLAQREGYVRDEVGERYCASVLARKE